MKLFRHHTAAFEEAIQKVNTFICDSSRKYNCTEKNKAKFYFYAADVKSAENYAVINDNSEVISDLHAYEIDNDVKLLDMRVVEQRARLTAVVEWLKADDLKNVYRCAGDMEKCIADNLEKLADRRTTGKRLLRDQIKAYQSIVDKCKAYIEACTNESIAAGIRYSGIELWGQRASDDKCGLVLKEELKRLGYDGAIFEEEGRTEVLLLKPAKQIN